MATYRLEASDWVYVARDDPYSNDRISPTVPLISSSGSPGVLYIKFKPLPESLWYKRIVADGTDVHVYAEATLSGWKDACADIYVDYISDDVDYDSLNYNNQPEFGALVSDSVTIKSGSAAGWKSLGPGVTFLKESLLRLFNNGIALSGVIVDWYGSGPLMVRTPTDQHAPYFELTYYVDAASQLFDISPQSGYVPKNGPSVFTWRVDLQDGEVCYGKMEQKSGTFRWRAKGTGTINSISCGTSQRCEVPAGTFSTDEIEWQVEVITSADQTITSNWYALSTVEALPEAVPISPVSTMVDGSAPCTFSWEHNIATSTQQTAADLQYHTGDGSWTTLGHVSGASTQYTVPANTFASGSVFWRVRTYNTDGAAGDWSGAAEIIVVAAPPEPVVMVTSGSAPRVSISWQSTDQQAWEAVVAGISSGIVYGLAKGWRLPDYLQDGTYTAKVRVCNKYNLWSPWGSCSVQVSNAAGDAIALTAIGGISVYLRWESSGYDVYYVLRDGHPIAKTTALSYTDNFCAGSHTYTVRGVFTDTGQYGLSNAVTAAFTCETVYISPVPNAKWLRLRYADTSDRRTSLNTSRTVNYQYLPGAEYPSAEISEWTSATMSVQCAFASPAESAELEALEGSLVCVKDRRGNCAIGVLEALDKQSSRFFDSFSFSIQRVNYVEEVTYD